MSPEDLLNEWYKDSQIERDKLDVANMSVQTLHAKYIKIWFAAKKELRRRQAEYAELRQARSDFLMMDTVRSGDYKDVMEERGWEEPPPHQKPLRTELNAILDIDKYLAKPKLDLDIHQELVNVIDSIVKTIGNRGYIIGKAIDYERWLAGQ